MALRLNEIKYSKYIHNHINDNSSINSCNFKSNKCKSINISKKNSNLEDESDNYDNLSFCSLDNLSKVSYKDSNLVSENITNTKISDEECNTSNCKLNYNCSNKLTQSDILSKSMSYDNISNKITSSVKIKSNDKENNFFLEYYINDTNKNEVYDSIINDLSKISKTLNNIGKNIEYFIDSLKKSENFINQKSFKKSVFQLNNLIKSLYTVFLIELNNNVLFINDNKNKKIYKTPIIKILYENNQIELKSHENIIQIVESICFYISFNDNILHFYIIDNSNSYNIKIGEVITEDINIIINDIIENAECIYEEINNNFNKISILINHLKIIKINSN